MRNFYLLDIDLTKGSSDQKDITNLFKEWIGGTGVATKLLQESPDSVIFAIGPLSQIFPVMTKVTALFKSPLTGNLGESHAGGRMALAMFESGNHVIRITGKCEKLSYLVIENDTIQIKRAESLKDFSALSTERVLREKEQGIGKRSIIRIGPAGERLSPIACATVDSSRHFGRLGLGAVLGEKKLKAILISGDREWEIPNPKEYRNLYQKLYKIVTESEATSKYHSLGTASNILPLSYINGLPVNNFDTGTLINPQAISGETWASRHLAQQISCAGCPIGCIHMAFYREMFDTCDNHYKSFKTSYDYELIYSLGSNLGIQSSDDILPLILAVEKQGWDAMSIGVTLAWATEAYKKGAITEKETDNLPLNFGDARTYGIALDKIAQGSNEFYKDLERGVVFCSQKYGGKEYTTAFGGIESPGYMTGPFAYLGYLTGVRHSHLDNAGYAIDQKLLNTKLTPEEAVNELYEEGIWRMIYNSLVGCLFARKIYTKELVLECLHVAGIEGYTAEILGDIAHKVHGLKFKYKLENGFRFEDLHLPEKLLKVKSGLSTIDPEEFNHLLALYVDKIKKDIERASSGKTFTSSQLI
jgi:aldehyde:ferredoxin oxidoreductase